MTTMEDIPQSWKPMESELTKAARKGNVKFLTRAIASSKPPEYWLSRFIPTQGKELYAGNILHLAVWHGKEDFVEEVIRELPEVVVSRLLRHREPAGEVRNRTPALLAIERGESSIAETLTSGSWAELIQDIVDDQGNSPLFLAVKNGLDNVVTNLLNCKGALCGRGPNGLTALHVVPGLLHDKYSAGSRWFSWLLGGGNNNGYEVSRMLLERLRELITTTDDNGFTILHKWVEMHSQSDISTKDRIEQLLTYFFKHCQDDAVKLMSMTDHIRGNNPLHHTVTCAPTSSDGVAKKLFELCKKCTTSEGSNLLQNHDKPWLMKNKDGDTPLFLAIHNNRDQLAVHFLSADPVGSLRLSDQRNPFVLALRKKCYKLAKEILAVIAEHHDLMSLLPFDDSPGPDILHLALRFPETFIEEVEEKLPSLKHGKKLGSYAEYRVFTWASWKSMDAELTKAAWSGDVDFLRDKIASEPRTYWLSRYVPSDDGVPYGGNIFHLAIWQMKTDFVKKAMGKLPKEVVDLLLWQQETAGELINSNPLHLAVSKKHHLLVKAIVERDNHTLLISSNRSRPLDVCPEIACKYRAKDWKGRAPALLAIEQGDSCCADILTSKHRAELIQDIVDNEGNSPLFLAVKKGLPKAVSHLLDCVGSLCSSGPDGSTALHVAAGLSNSSDNVDVIYEKLFRRFPKLITERDNNGFTVLHKWVEMGCKPVDDHAADKSNLESLLEYFFNSHGADAAKLMLATDSTAGNNPLHTLVATSTSTSTVSEPVAVKIATQLTGLFKECAASNLSQNHDRPWFMKNKNGDTPLLLAMHYKLEDLAFCFLKYDRKKTLLASAEKENPLEFAVNNGCQRVVAEILDIIVAEKDLTSLLTFSDGSNVLHSASASDFPEKVIKKVVEKFPHLITLADGEVETPLDKASGAGKLWLVELMVKKDPGSLSKACHAWQRACEEGHLDVIKLFIKHCPAFRGICLGRRDTPLHHLNREKCGYAQYRELLDHKVIAQMINTRDSQHKTPLHRAIMEEDIDLTEVLLTMDDINFYIKDKEENTAMDLLAQISEHKGEWRDMCERVEIDPRLKTTYVQRHKDLLKIREALLVVAALLAGITFQAGFTLPGGLKNDSGEAVLAKKGAFLAFLLADAYGMCCSILVLFCLLWSMFCGGDKSMLLIDWSMSILLHSLYASLVAFMTGVYIVISHGSMWAAITTIVMCSVIGISAINGKILQRLLSIANRGYYKLLKGLGKAFTSMKKSSGTDSMGEATTTTNQSSDRNSEEQVPISTIKSSDSNSKGEASTSRSKRSETNSKGEASVSTIESSDRNSTSDHIVQIQIK